ncbi:MAG: peptidoglycan DD-metalloendopeptidase family protein [Magnetovibrio sp.]|nr:peptidoglycan DD-metalloendopeptidase family protein [Magnetovibrio sp.]
MLLRGIGTIAGLAVTGALCAGYVSGHWTLPDGVPAKASSSLALAPISLGNPSAASGPETTGPKSPFAVGRAPDAPVPVVEHRFPVREGDTLATVLERAGVAGAEARAAIQAFSKKHNPRYIRSGQELRVRYQPAAADDQHRAARPGDFAGFAFRPAYDSQVEVARTEADGFTARIVATNLERQVARAEGHIDSSLYVAGKKAGLTSQTLVELIRAFSWDVDFQRGIRRGDSFELMFNYVLNEDGRIVRSDEILFAALTLSGKRRAIYRLDGKDGAFEYFDVKGHSAQKALMRTPIDGARLSSGFGKRRHPILGYTKMHRGVDFAAPTGTPIYAAGNGVIDFAGRKGGYGKYIRIRHNGTYSTAYAHMSRYGRGMRTGRRVRQGQIIGYVGTTGRSTGPHLHYEIMRNGRQLNPMRLKMPSGRKLIGNELVRFHALRKALDKRYQQLPKGRALVAQNKN